MDRDYKWLLGAVALLAAGSIGCLNDCGFWEQCDGNVVQICGEGPDQMFGREVKERRCEGETPVCIEVNSQLATCVSDQPCDASYTTTCEDDVFTRCVTPEGETRGNLSISNCKDIGADYGCGMVAGQLNCVYRPQASMPADT